MSFELHPEAALEHENQVAYYEQRSAGLGQRYHAATLRAIRAAVDSPSRFKSTGASGLRRVALQGFPLYIVYRAVGAQLQVLAVAHFRRRPGYWADRT